MDILNSCSINLACLECHFETDYVTIIIIGILQHTVFPVDSRD